MNRDLFLALLAMDVYNRGYGQSVKLKVGDVKNGQNELERKLSDARVTAQTITGAAQAAGFYAIADDVSQAGVEELTGTVMSYRGTNVKGLSADQQA